MSVRVLIGSSSHAFGRGLSECLQRDGDITVVGIVEDTVGILRAASRERPDLVVLELDLPPGRGEEATHRILRECRARVALIVAHDELRSERAAAALTVGAVAVVPRSAVSLDSPDGELSIALRRRVRRLATARSASDLTLTQPSAPVAVVSSSLHRPHDSHRAEVVGICVSTGGPGALARVLGDLPADFRLPVLVVQHMGDGFIDGLASWLDAAVPLAVRVAREGESLAPGVRLAPDGAHLTLAAGRLELDRITVCGPHRPSGDILLSSVARSAGPGAVAVVMTGMGRDGAAGLAEVGAAGGRTIAQDEASSTIYGMPRVAAELGAGSILPLGAIAPALVAISRNGQP